MLILISRSTRLSRGGVGEANLQLLCKYLNKSVALVNESLNPSSAFVILLMIHGEIIAAASAFSASGDNNSQVLGWVTNVYFYFLG